MHVCYVGKYRDDNLMAAITAALVIIMCGTILVAGDQ